ncbi:Z1 domain-containing protein [Burkholderia ambifaria]|uniref:Z1 domain-containing protein n=1 Tax=Burkholderia ambifaria TaxID=152480 RepID=UPI00158A0B0D|nr:Z1 domain-containing protein [Burkholderia ambifaria]
MSPQEFENQVRSNLNNRTSVTPDLIRSVVRLTLQIQGDDAPQFESEDLFVEQISRSIEEKLDLSMPDAAVVKLPFKEWLPERRADTDLFYWNRYRDWLLQSGFAKEVVGTIGRDTDKIVGLLENPEKSGPWKRRGLVVGHVQSGKTANYNGVVCKSADYGYKVIILLAGVHNNLRSQTQQRVEEAFIGVDTDKKDRNLPLKDIKTGVGRISDVTRLPFSLTSREHDFRKDSAKAATFSLNAISEPVVFVIKKQATVLQNLHEWFLSLNDIKGGKIQGIPMLLIDDEADNASVNVAKGEGDPTKINGLIRKLLALFEQNSYVGYTATPFANIFIDPDSSHAMLEDDLFPKDFIVNLDAPDNYVSAARIFGENGDLVHLVESVSDHVACFPERHKIEHKVETLPSSLLEAVRRFVLGRAVRILRGRGQDHSSMLVNVSRFNSVQRQVTALLTNYLEEVLNAVKLHAALPDKMALRDPTMQALKETWDRYPPSHGETWEKAKRVLANGAGAVVVRTINNSSPDRLDYRNYRENGLHVVAVGGLSLSRGFTLEGLTTSYFIRNSIMYDTLLQMGRWFGYRDGYLDLCSIYMTDGAVGWYSHISMAIDELRAEFRLMEQQGRKPEEFGLKVRTHPDSLIVTARNKMRTGRKVVHSVSLAGRLVETVFLKSAPSAIDGNFRKLRAFVEALEAEKAAQYNVESDLGYLWSQIKADDVCRFLQSFENHDDASAITQSRPIIEFIKADPQNLGEWDVCLYTLKKGEKEQVGPLHIVPQERACAVKGGCYQIGGAKMRVASRGSERVGLTQDQIDAVADEAGNANVPDAAYRSRRTRPLLMLHVLNLFHQGDENKVSLAKLVCAWGISFPGSKEKGRGAEVEYMVNTVWWQEQYQEQIEDEDDEVANAVVN